MLQLNKNENGSSKENFIRVRFIYQRDFLLLIFSFFFFLFPLSLPSLFSCTFFCLRLSCLLFSPTPSSFLIFFPYLHSWWIMRHCQGSKLQLDGPNIKELFISHSAGAQNTCPSRMHLLQRLKHHFLQVIAISLVSAVSIIFFNTAHLGSWAHSHHYIISLLTLFPFFQVSLLIFLWGFMMLSFPHYNLLQCKTQNHSNSCLFTNV